MLFSEGWPPSRSASRPAASGSPHTTAVRRPAGASSPVAGSYRSPVGTSGSREPAVSVARSRDSTRAARFAEGREKEYAMAISSKCRSGYVSSMTALYTVTSSPTVIRPCLARCTPCQTTAIISRPGSSTWIAEISAHIRALRTAAWRTSCEARR